MWWGLGFVGVVLWLTLLVVLGTATLRNGHWVMFILGIPLPIFWAIGALIEPTPRAREAF
jgi:hypothetical protein